MHITNIVHIDQNMEKEKKWGFINTDTLVDIFQMSTAGFSCNAVAPSFTLQYSRSSFNNQKFISVSFSLIQQALSLNIPVGLRRSS